jgi:protein ImuB
MQRMAAYERLNVMIQRVLCIWLPNWPVQRVQAVEPQLANIPLALQFRDARRGLIVAAANLAARAQGVRPGMSISEATALTQLEVRTHDPSEDMDHLCSLTEQAQQFSPLVGLEQLDKKLWTGRTLLQPECLLLDITGLASHFGGEQCLLTLVSDWLYEHHYFGCMAIAGNIGAAWAVANYGHRKRSSPSGKTLQRRATQRTAPPTSAPAAPDANTPSVPISQFLIVGCGQEGDALQQLPIAALRLPFETVQSLQRLGIDTIGQLSTLPRAGMSSRLGQALLDRWDQAVGLKSEALIALHALPEWQIDQTLEYPTEHQGTIAELVKRLSGDLARRLSARGQGAMRIVCRLDLVEATPLIMQLGLFRPSADAEHLQALLAGQLEQQLRGRRPAAVWRLSMQATLTAPLVWHQTDLFEGDAIENRHQIARLVDNLSNRLGRKNVLRCKVERESQPEQGCSLQPMTGRRPDGAQQATVKKLSSRLARNRAEPSAADPMRRPTRLLSPPLAIDVIALAAEGVPARFRVHQQVYTVLQHWGPERIESGWWRGPSVRRDYFRVESEHGAWWWLYRDLKSDLWYLHGVFD